MHDRVKKVLPVHFSNWSQPGDEIAPSLPRSGISQTSNKTPGAYIITPESVADVTATADNRKGLQKTKIKITSVDPAYRASETSASNLHRELNPDSTEAPMTNVDRLSLRGGDPVAVSTTPAARVLAARAAAVAPAPVTVSTTPVATTIPVSSASTTTPGSIRATKIREARATSPSTTSTTNPAPAGVPVPAAPAATATAVVPAAGVPVPTAATAAAGVPVPTAVAVVPVPTAPVVSATAATAATPNPHRHPPPPRATRNNSLKKAKMANATTANTLGFNPPSSTIPTPVTVNPEISYNKELCTLLRFGPYDDSNSEYVELDSNTFKTTTFQFNEFALGQNELKKYYNITSEKEIEILQNVFGVKSLGTDPYFATYKKNYSTTPCKFNGIVDVIKAIVARKKSLEEQVKSESANAKKRRLQHQLDWFTETVEFLEKAKSSSKDCVDVPTCTKKKESSGFSWPSWGAKKPITSSGNGSCFFDITLLYKIVALINHLQNTAPNELKDQLNKIPITELLKIAKNSNSKEDMTGLLKSVLGHLLEYLMALKNTPNMDINPKILLDLYKAITTSDKTKTSISIPEFMAFINTINLKLRHCSDKSQKLLNITKELNDCKKIISDSLELVGAAKIEWNTILQGLAALQVNLSAERAENLKTISDMKAKITKIGLEVYKYKGKYEACVAGKGKPGAEVKKLREEIDKLVKEKTELIDLVRQAQEKEILLRKSITDLVNNLNEVISELKGNLAIAQTELVTLKKTHAEALELVAKLQKELADTKDSVAKLEASKTDVEKLNVRINVLEALVKDTLSGIQQAQKLVETINTELEALRVKLEFEVEALQKELIDTKAEIEKLKADHIIDQQKMTDLIEIINTAQAELLYAEEELAKLRGRNKINTQSEIKRLKSELLISNAKYEELKKSCLENDILLKALQAKFDSTLTNLNVAKEELATALSELNALKASQSEKDQRTSEFVRDLIDKIGKLKEDISVLRDQGGISIEQQGDIKELKDNYFKEFNKNLKKDELIKIYLDIINSMIDIDDSQKEKLKNILQQLKEKESDYDDLIKTLETELQKDPVIFTLIIDRLIPIIETNQIIIEDLSAKEELKGLIQKIKILEAEKDTQINKLTTELDAAQKELAAALSGLDTLKVSQSEKDQRTSEFVRNLIDKIERLEGEIKVDSHPDLKVELDAAQKELAAALSELDALKVSQSKLARFLIEKINKLESDIKTLRDQGGISTEQQGDIQELKDNYFKEFNKNIKKDELIQIYLDIINSMIDIDDSQKETIKNILQQLKEKEDDYEALLITLETELQKDPVIFTLIIDRLIPIIETNQIIIEDLSAKEELKGLIEKIKILEAEKDTQINKLTTELDSLKKKHLTVIEMLKGAQSELRKTVEALDKARKKPESVSIGVGTEVKTGEAGVGTEVKTGEVGVGTKVKTGEMGTGTNTGEMGTGTNTGEMGTGTNTGEMGTGTNTGEMGTGTNTTTDETGVGTDLSALSINELEEKVKTQENIIKNLKLKQVEFETTIRNLERNKVSQQSTIDAQLSRINSLEEEVTKLNNANRQEMERLSGVLDGVSADRDTCKTMLEDVKAEIERLKASLKTSEDRLAMCQAEIEAKDKQIAELRLNIGKKGDCEAQILALQTEKMALEDEKKRLITSHEEQVKSKDASLKICEDRRLIVEGELNMAIEKLKEATSEINSEAASYLALLEKMRDDYEKALERANAFRDSSLEVANAAAAAAEAARGVAEAALLASKTGEDGAKARAEAAENAARVAEKARDAALDIASTAAGEAARVVEEANAAKRDVEAAMAEAERIKAEGERNIAAAQAAQIASKKESDAAKLAIDEANRLMNEANKLRIEADAALLASKEGRGANATAVAEAQRRADVAEEAAREAGDRAKEAIANAEAQVARANADAEAARAEADIIKKEAIAAKEAASDATKAKEAAEANATAMKGSKEQAEADKVASDTARDAAITASKASTADATAARAEATAARAEADAALARANAADAAARIAGSGRNSSSAEATRAKAEADAARKEAADARAALAESEKAKQLALDEAEKAKLAASAAEARANTANSGRKSNSATAAAATAAAVAEAKAAKDEAEAAKAKAEMANAATIKAEAKAIEAERIRDAALAEAERVLKIAEAAARSASSGRNSSSAEAAAARDEAAKAKAALAEAEKAKGLALAEAEKSKLAASAAEERAAAANSGRKSNSAAAAAARDEATKAIEAAKESEKAKLDALAEAEKAKLAASAAEARAIAAEARTTTAGLGRNSSSAEAAAARDEAIKARAAADKAQAGLAQAEKDKKDAKDDATAAKAATELAQAEAVAAKAEAVAAKAEAAAAKAEAAAAKAEAAGSNDAKTKAETALAARETNVVTAREAASVAEAKAAKAEADAKVAIANAKTTAEKEINDAKTASQKAIEKAAIDLAEAIAVANGKATEGVKNAQNAMKTAQDASTALEKALATIRAQLEAETARANAAEKRAEKAEDNITNLEAKITELTASLDECKKSLDDMTNKNKKTHDLLDKLLVLVATDDDEMNETAEFMKTEGVFEDFRKLKGGPATLGTHFNLRAAKATNKTLINNVMTNLLNDQLNDTINALKDANLYEESIDIFKFYNITSLTSIERINNLRKQIGSLLQRLIDNSKESEKIIIKGTDRSEISSIINTIKNIDPTKSPFQDKAKKLSTVLKTLKIDNLLKNYVLDNDKEQITKVDKDILNFNTELIRIPMIILAIKYLQLWK